MAIPSFLCLRQPSDSDRSCLKTINGVNFTPREVDVVACLLSGRSSKTIARFLSIEEKTVETHKYNIMRKLECNFKEGIIEFIETSDKFSALKDHYLDLLKEVTFEKYLDQIRNLSGNGKKSCILLYEALENRMPFVHQLEKHLSRSGIKVHKETTENGTPLMQGIDTQETDLVIYLTPEKPCKGSQRSNIQEEIEVDDLIKKFNLQANKFIFLVEYFEDTSKETQDIKIENDPDTDYYPAVLKILQALLPGVEIEKISLEFKKQGNTNNSSNHFPIYQKPGLDIKIVDYESSSHANRSPSYSVEKQKNITIKSDLVIPTESTLLERNALISQIEGAFEGDEDIKTVALVGIGGSGKTTIARLYARDQKKQIVWEINAETQENLIFSFENFAYALSQTEDEKRMLRGLQEINNQKDKEDKIILFVKDKLKSRGDWFLIYDNVKKFSDIQKYFPFNIETWGNGKIILTSRDSNIQYNDYIKVTIAVTELGVRERIILFNKIMMNEYTIQLPDNQTNQLVFFLNHIPPFPLDVSIAAYYLKMTNISYERYMEYLSTHNKDLDLMQQDLIREATHYAKTRYSILTLSLDCLIKANEDFEELILLISLIDSQNIPKDMLSAFKNEIIADSFIYHLRKYSLTICKQSVTTNFIPYFSIHRSTQEISLAYLTKKLSLKEGSFLELVIQKFEKYAAKVLDNIEFSTIRNLKSHCEVLLSHKNLLTKYMEASIEGILGAIGFNLGDYLNAQSFLEKSLKKLNRDKIKDRERTAMILIYNGMVYRKLGCYEKAKDAIETGLTIYEKDFPDKHLEFAWALGNLGTIYRNFGNYEEAKTFFEKSLTVYRKYFSDCYIGTAWALAHLGNMYRNMGNYGKAHSLLKQSLSIYKKKLPENHIEIAWALTYLGDTYRGLGKYDEAEKSLKESLKIYEEEFGKGHVDVGWVLTYLGKVYSDLGNQEKAINLFKQGLQVRMSLAVTNPIRHAWHATLLGTAYKDQACFETAKELLEESFATFDKYFGRDHIFTAWAMLYLGEFYRDLENYEKAEELLKQSLKVYENKFGSNHIKTARILRGLGEIYILQGYLENAKKYTRRALLIYHQNEHPSNYKVSENMAKILLDQSTHEENMNQAQNYKKQAIDYQQEALRAGKESLPKDSPHIIRIQTKLNDMTYEGESRV